MKLKKTKFFIASIALIYPLGVSAKIVDFLKPEIDQTSKRLVCFDQQKTDCQVLVTISGQRFLNSQTPGSVRLGSRQATILRWTDSMVTAAAPAEYYEMTPILKVDSSIELPQLSTGVETLDVMFESAVEMIIDNVKMTDEGHRYLSAGAKYEDVARTYFRDAYWASGLMLMIEPYVVRDEILLLADGVEEDGRAPSAICLDEACQPLELWDDHFDSGPYLIMLVEEYIRWTGEEKIIEEKIGGRSLLSILRSIIQHLQETDSDSDGLPEKPNDSLRDWLDNIPRGGEVLYDSVLYYRALKAMADIETWSGEKNQAATYEQTAKSVKRQINFQFWNKDDQNYYESCQASGCVKRLTNESGLAILFGLPNVKRRHQLFDGLRQLETRFNDDQPYGDWGVLNAWPAYEENRLKKYHYQNATDWPWLDGVNAAARLLYRNDDWEYPLTRWWTASEELGRDPTEWPEFVSPIDDAYSSNQSWSVTPVVSLIRYGLGLNPDRNGFYVLREPPWGKTTGSDFVVRGERINF